MLGYLPVNRKIFEHEFWQEKREFSRFEAWLDLLRTARYEAEPKTEWFNNKPVIYKRGQLPASVRFLQNRWHWGSITKVENFLKYLKNKDMIVLEKGQGINVITVCKYDSYNLVEKPKKTTKGQGQGRQKDKSNKDNKYNSDSVADAPSLYELAITFWLKEFHTGWDFGGVQGKSLNTLLGKLSKTLSDSNIEPTDEEVLKYFKKFCLNLPDWFKEKDLPILSSKYNEIVAEIKLKNSRPEKKADPELTLSTLKGKEKDDYFGGKNENFVPKVA